MANYRGTKTVNSGCVFAVDGLNTKSYNSGSAPNDVLNIIDTSQTGSLQNGVAYTNGVWDFDGTDDYIDFGTPSPNIQSLLKDDPKSVECWINLNSLTTRTIFTTCDASAARRGFQLDIWNSAKIAFIQLGIASQFTYKVADNANLSTNVWYHIVATIDDTNTSGGINIYINGDIYNGATTVSDTMTTTDFTNSNMFIGSRKVSNVPNQIFNGQISNVKIYNRELTSQEVSTNYNSLKGRVQ